MKTFKEILEETKNSPVPGMTHAEYRREEGSMFSSGKGKPKLEVGAKVHVNGKHGVVKDIYTKKTSVGNKKFMHVDHDGTSEHYRIDTTNHRVLPK